MNLQLPLLFIVGRRGSEKVVLVIFKYVLAGMWLVVGFYHPAMLCASIGYS